MSSIGRGKKYSVEYLQNIYDDSENDVRKFAEVMKLSIGNTRYLINSYSLKNTSGFQIPTVVRRNKYEKEYMCAVLDECDGNVSKLARKLHITWDVAKYWLNKYSLTTKPSNKPGGKKKIVGYKKCLTCGSKTKNDDCRICSVRGLDSIMEACDIRERYKSTY